MAEINIEDNLEKINVWVDNVREIAYQLQENIELVKVSNSNESETIISNSDSNISTLNNVLKERRDLFKKLEDFEREIQKKVSNLIQTANVPELKINNTHNE